MLLPHGIDMEAPFCVQFVLIIFENLQNYRSNPIKSGMEDYK